MATSENKDVSWFKIIAGSAIGTVVGYLTLMVICFVCYIIIFVVFLASAGSSLNTTNLYNELAPVMNTYK